MAWPSPNPTSMKSCKNHSICFLALLLTLLSLSNSARADLNGDAQALLAFKRSFPNAEVRLVSWNDSTIANICTNDTSSWKGVTCGNDESGTQRITKLRLPGSSLVGPIPPQTLGNLDALEVLSLRKNSFSGSLPSDLANCTALRELNLNSNNFSGALLLNFSALPLLKRLDLSSNNFSGQIPPSVSNLTNLEYFNVSYNRFNGSIPFTLSQFAAQYFEGNPDLCGAPLPTCISPPPAPASTSNDDNNDNGKKLSGGQIAGIVVGGVVAAFMVALCIFFLFFARKKKKQGDVEGLYADGRAEFDSKTKQGAISNTREAAINRKGSGKSGGNEGVNRKGSGKRGGNGGVDRKGSGKSGGNEGVNSNNKLIFMGDGKKTFDLDDLLRASAEVLGKGSLGTSYKALMEEGHPYSVKRFREVATEREDTCKHIEMLGTLRHPNLVPLRAYFFAPKGKLLVSDYMPKGNLSKLLHGKKGEVKELLSWEARLAIAGGAAKGVVFLHSKKIVHGNIKSTNVVMDSDDEPRLTDYSLVQLLPREPASNLKPNAYTPPEAREDLRKITYKGDVYAFGVLLLELVTGLSPSNGDANIDELVQWVQGHFPQNVESVLDPLLDAKSDDSLQDQMISLLQIALPCVSSSPEKRPHMVEVVSSIENLRKREDHPDSSDFYFTQAV